MKELRFNHSVLRMLVVLFLTSCDAVFVPDPVDPRLPKYTEDGNNVAGALVNGDLWHNYYTNFFLLLIIGSKLKLTSPIV